MKVGAGYMTSRKRPDAAAPERKVSLNRAGTYCDEELSVVVVADGAVGTKRPAASRRAAKINVETMIAFFQNKWTWRITDKNEFKDAALRELMTAYEAEAKNGKYAVDDLSATVSAVALKTNGEFLAISIGSGTVAALNHEMQPSVLIPPNPNKKRCVNHIDSAKRSIKAWGGTLEQSPFIAFAVYTTGAGSLVMEDSGSQHSLRTAAACTLFGSGDEYISKMMAEIIKDGENKDAALAVIVAESDETIKVGRAVLLEAQSAQSAALEEEAEEEKEAEPKLTVEEIQSMTEAPSEPAPEIAPVETETKSSPNFAVPAQNEIPPVPIFKTDAVVVEPAPAEPAESISEIVEEVRTIIPEAPVVAEVENEPETEAVPETPPVEEEPVILVKDENITAVPAEKPKKRRKAPANRSESSALELDEDAVKMLDSVEPMYRPLMKALLDAPRSAGELVESGYCPEGHILGTVLPLIRSGHVVYQDGVFSAGDSD